MTPSHAVKRYEDFSELMDQLSPSEIVDAVNELDQVRKQRDELLKAANLAIYESPYRSKAHIILNNIVKSVEAAIAAAEKEGEV